VRSVSNTVGYMYIIILLLWIVKRLCEKNKPSAETIGGGGDGGKIFRSHSVPQRCLERSPRTRAGVMMWWCVCVCVCVCVYAVRDCREIHGTPLVAAVVHKTVVAVVVVARPSRSGGCIRQWRQWRGSLARCPQDSPMVHLESPPYYKHHVDRTAVAA